MYLSFPYITHATFILGTWENTTTIVLLHEPSRNWNLDVHSCCIHACIINIVAHSQVFAFWMGWCSSMPLKLKPEWAHTLKLQTSNSGCNEAEWFYYGKRVLVYSREFNATRIGFESTGIMVSSSKPQNAWLLSTHRLLVRRKWSSCGFDQIKPWYKVVRVL